MLQICGREIKTASFALNGYGYLLVFLYDGIFTFA